MRAYRNQYRGMEGEDSLNIVKYKYIEKKTRSIYNSLYYKKYRIIVEETVFLENKSKENRQINDRK